MVNKSFFIMTLTAAMFMWSSVSWSQVITYPDSVKDIFEKTDAAESALRTYTPVIAVPEGFPRKELDKIVSCGGAPVIIPRTEDGAMLRDQAFSWDGAAALPGWVKVKDSFSVLFYKAVTDQNIPFTGQSALVREIDKGLMRYPDSPADYPALIAKARIYHEAKELMERIFSIDTHGDLPCCYEDGYELGRRADNQVSIPKMQEGRLDSQVLIAYIGQHRFGDEDAPDKAFAYCDSMVDSILADIEKNSAFCGLARTPEDALKLKQEGKKAFFMAMENGYGLGEDLSNIEYFARKGLVYVSLSHLYDNAICHSSTHSADTTAGLTDYGRKVVAEMNRCGIIIDCSHPSSGTFWDCIRYSKAPIICSHSGAMAVFKHDRNITDEQLRALRKNGGVIQVYLVPDYMGEDLSKVSIDDMMEHLYHCIDVAGIDHVGIAVDLDGGGGGIGENGDNDAINVTMRLLEKGFSASDIAKIWGGNFLRVLSEVQRLSTL